MDYNEAVEDIRRDKRLDNLEKSKRINQVDDKRVHLMLYFFGNSSHTNACDFTIL